MASFHNLAVPDLLRAARDLYTNARDDAETFAVLSAEPWEFTAADFDAGLALVDAVTRTTSMSAVEDLEAQAATHAYDDAVAAVEKTYARHRIQGRKRYRRGTPEYSALHLGGEAPDDREDLLRDAGTFYDALANSPEAVATVRAYSDAVIADAQALIAAAIKAGSAQTKEGGEAEIADAERTAAIAALREHGALTASECADALADHPQHREKLGLLERS